MVSDNKLKYYIIDRYDIPSGIITATISKYSFFAFISSSSNKGFLFDANNIVACGNLSNEVIEQCKNPYPVYGTMFDLGSLRVIMRNLYILTMKIQIFRLKTLIKLIRV